MAVDRSATLYPKNATTVDSGGAVDVRILSSTNGSTAEANTVTCAHTADNTERTFDPGSSINSILDCRSSQKLGWALRLTEDMTPSDDTNCNVLLPAQTVSVGIRVSMAASGGTGYTGGVHTPTFRLALFAYDPATDTGTHITDAASAALSWDLTPVTGDGGALKNTTFTMTVVSDYEFPQGTILLLQVGLNTGTLANPVTGTTTYTFTYRSDSNSSFVTWAAGKLLTSLCGMAGSAAGVGSVSGVASKVLATVGAASGAGTVAGVMSATAAMTGSAAGVASASGQASSVAAAVGDAAGSATVSGSASRVLGTVGSVSVAGSGGTTRRFFPITD